MAEPCSCEQRKANRTDGDTSAWDNKSRRATTDTERACVATFQAFLRIRTISGEGPKGPYREAVDWLQSQCRRLGLATQVVELVEGKPVLIASWHGTEPGLPSVLLNSHYDVVPTYPEQWCCDPFAAVREEDTGRIYGRGTQDMKCVCVQYLAAIEELQRQDWKPRRTIHLTFVPDEEIGGLEGMGRFRDSPAFQALAVGVALDEGLANPRDAFTVFYGERNPWWVSVTAKGPTGHGSRFIANTAPSKLLHVANQALQFRAEQEALFGYQGAGCAHAQAKKLGDVATLNLTMLQTGVSSDGGKTFALNVIPTEARAGFDIRIPPSMPMGEMQQRLDAWTADPDVSWTHVPWTEPAHAHFVSRREGCPWWSLFEKTLAGFGKTVEPEIFPASTDSRFLRELGIPAFGFSPMANTPILLHEHNEYIDEGVFLEGIEVYVRVIGALAAAPAFGG